ncbi:MAG TPA: DUF1292 domain-containing protein [Eubacteriales bacterium]|nr:DUF1292 domain-containing protein [Clostridia bacterium]HRR89424.1 DUF1292 domain-containing protein [Eubacteriales bacterium]HRU84438.1 DUF1292 domain-containing protein [Eubacteriales bacterium]
MPSKNNESGNQNLKDIAPDIEEVTPEEESDIITLHNEKLGIDEDFYVIATLDYEEKWYVFLIPVNPTDDIGADECLIFELATDENGEDIILPVTDEKILDGVYEVYLEEMRKLEKE